MKIEKYKGGDEEFLCFRLKRSDADKFLFYTIRIENWLKNRKVIPPRVFQELIQLLGQKDNEEEYYLTLRNTLQEDVYNFLTQPRMKFDFLIKLDLGIKIDIPIDKDERGVLFGQKVQATEKLTLNKLIQEAIEVAIRCFIANDLIRDLIAKVYISIDNYTMQSKELRNLYNHYKITVITAYIAFRLGYTLSDELSKYEFGNNKPTTKQLEKAIDSVTIKIKTY